MKLNTLVALLEDSDSGPDTLERMGHNLDLIYTESLDICSGKEGIDERYKVGKKNQRKTSEIHESINNITTLHVAIFMNRPDYAKWIIDNKPELLEKDCKFHQYEYFTIYEKTNAKSNAFHSGWKKIGGGGGDISTHTVGSMTPLELAEHLDNDCVHMPELTSMSTMSHK